MSSFFSFGFHGDDIDPEDEAPEDAPQSTPQTRQGGGAQLGELHQPHIHTLEDMVSSCSIYREFDFECFLVHVHSY